MKSCSVAIQMKPLCQYFCMVSFVFQYFTNEIWDFSCAVWPFKWNLFACTFAWYHLIFQYFTKRNLGFFCVVWPLKCMKPLWQYFCMVLFVFPYFAKWNSFFLCVCVFWFLALLGVKYWPLVELIFFFPTFCNGFPWQLFSSNSASLNKVTYEHDNGLETWS